MTSSFQSMSASPQLPVRLPVERRTPTELIGRPMSGLVVVERDAYGEGGRRVAEEQASVGGDRRLLQVQRPAERHLDVRPERRAAVVGQHDAVVLARLL